MYGNRMAIIQWLFRLIVTPPAFLERSAKFNKLQCFVYPEICKEQMDKAMKYCDAKTEQKQRAIANTFLRNIF